MQAEIDISLLTETSAVGRVSGQLEFVCLPRVGDTVSLSQAVIEQAGFSGHLTVEHVIHSPNSSIAPMLSLSDVVAVSEAAAKLLGATFAAKYGLFFELYEA